MDIFDRVRFKKLAQRFQYRPGGETKDRQGAGMGRLGEELD